MRTRVVSYLFPISNHNSSIADNLRYSVVSYLFPISNHNWFTHAREEGTLYLISFLYQTTTRGRGQHEALCCILSLSYIKPQPVFRTAFRKNVVSYLFPISNHNFDRLRVFKDSVVSYLFPISNHNLSVIMCYISSN